MYRQLTSRCYRAFTNTNKYAKIGGIMHGKKTVYLFSFSLPTIGFTVSAFSFGKTTKATKLDDERKITETADRLYDESKFNEIYALLEPYKDSDNVEYVYRLARATYQLANEVKTVEEKKILMGEAFGYAKHCVAVNDQHWASHKWFAILLDKTNELEGKKARLTDSERVKAHTLRATELNPADATSWHMLGVWCFSFADLPWYQRQLASVIFATPPTSTFEEALYFFLKAEQINPNLVFIENMVYIGKTYIRLNDNAKAVTYLKQALSYNVKTEDDRKARDEAKELLVSLGAAA